MPLKHQRPGGSGSRDPGNTNLSTHTATNERLLIAKRNGWVSNPQTMFVNLRRFPTTVATVQEVISAILCQRERS